MDGNSVDKEFYDSIEKSINEQMQQCKTKSLSRIVELEEETCRLQEKVRELEEKYSTQKNMKENAELLKKSKACFGCGTVVRAILFCSEDCEKQRGSIWAALECEQLQTGIGFVRTVACSKINVNDKSITTFNHNYHNYKNQFSYQF